MTLPNALFLGWNRPIPGREGAAAELYQAMQTLLGDLKNNGKIQSFDGCILAVHGGDMNGFWTIRADYDQIVALRKNPDLYKLIIQCTSVLQGFGQIEAYTGEAAGGLMQDWMKLVAGK